MTKLEEVARAIARQIVERDTAEAQFAYGSGPGYHEGRGRHAQLAIDIEAEIEAMWPDLIPAARVAIRIATATFVQIRDWNHDEAWQARNGYESAVREIDALLSEGDS